MPDDEGAYRKFIDALSAPNDFLHWRTIGALEQFWCCWQCVFMATNRTANSRPGAYTEAFRFRRQPNSPIPARAVANLIQRA